MKFHDLQSYIRLLENEHELVRISAQVSPELEMTAVADQLSKGPTSRNKAVLFENVAGSEFPVLLNMFGSARRMAWSLHVEELEDLNSNLAKLIDLKLPDSAGSAATRGLALLSALRAAGLKPKKVRRAPVHDVVLTSQATLDELPILTCWPKDGGPFVTLPQVVTRDPVKGTRNVGMYRLQKVDSRTLLVHWQRHKGGAEHERVAIENRRPAIPAAIVLGGDPACIWSASAPLPPDIDEYLLAGWLRGRPVEFTECVTQPLSVPAHADFVIEGYIDPNEHFPEGPFGDHTGYYTPVEPFPAFHVTAITHRRDAIYPATVVGVPPMEDYWMGKATERLFLSLLKLFVPEVVDFAMPAAGVFHNLVLVSIRKRYPGHARKVIHAMWGLALLSLAKCIVVVDDWVDVQNLTLSGWQALGNVDWSHDVMIAPGPVDQLDHASYLPSFGGKIGIDATAKLPEEGYQRTWPEVVSLPDTIQERMVDLLKAALDNDA